jgi:hypothetical protein
VLDSATGCIKGFPCPSWGMVSNSDWQRAQMLHSDGLGSTTDLPALGSHAEELGEP